MLIFLLFGCFAYSYVLLYMFRVVAVLEQVPQQRNYIFQSGICDEKKFYKENISTRRPILCISYMIHPCYGVNF
jgi:hypothetical protein